MYNFIPTLGYIRGRMEGSANGCLLAGFLVWLLPLASWGQCTYRVDRSTQDEQARTRTVIIYPTSAACTDITFERTGPLSWQSIVNNPEPSADNDSVPAPRKPGWQYIFAFRNSQDLATTSDTSVTYRIGELKMTYDNDIIKGQLTMAGQRLITLTGEYIVPPSTGPDSVAHDTIPQVKQWVYAFGGEAKNITIRDLIIEKYNNPGHSAAIGYKTNISFKNLLERTGWIVDNNEIRHNHGGGVEVKGAGQIRNNYIHHNGQMGVFLIGRQGENRDGSSAYIPGTPIVENNEIAFNRVPSHGFFANYEGGGLKAAYIGPAGLRILNNQVHDNYGNGIWIDVCPDSNANLVYAGNIVTNNDGTGIFHEVSGGGLISENTLAGNGKDSTNPVALAQIIITSSSGVQVLNNSVVINETGRDGIYIRESSRAFGRSNRVLYNDITYSGNNTLNKKYIGTFTTTHTVGDTGTIQNFLDEGDNLFDYNTYHFTVQGANVDTSTALQWVWADANVGGFFNRRRMTFSKFKRQHSLKNSGIYQEAHSSLLLQSSRFEAEDTLSTSYQESSDSTGTNIYVPAACSPKVVALPDANDRLLMRFKFNGSGFYQLFVKVRSGDADYSKDNYLSRYTFQLDSVVIPFKAVASSFEKYDVCLPELNYWGLMTSALEFRQDDSTEHTLQVFLRDTPDSTDAIAYGGVDYLEIRKLADNQLTPDKTGVKLRFEAEEHYGVILNDTTGGREPITQTSCAITSPAFTSVVLPNARTAQKSGDKIRVHFRVAKAGDYRLKVRLQTGYGAAPDSTGTLPATSIENFPAGYEINLDDRAVLTYPGPTPTPTYQDSCLAGSYWAVVSYPADTTQHFSWEEGYHSLDLEAQHAYAAIDYLELEEVVTSDSAQARIATVSQPDNITVPVTVVYPNPFQEEVTVQLGAATGPVSYVLLDTWGRVVDQKQALAPTPTSELTLRIAKELPAGVYILQLMPSQGPVRTVKVVKSL